MSVILPVSLPDPLIETPLWQLTPRELFSESTQAATEDVVDLYEDGQTTDFPPNSVELSHHIAQLEREVTKKYNRITEHKSTVEELSRGVDQKKVRNLPCQSK